MSNALVIDGKAAASDDMAQVKECSPCCDGGGDTGRVTLAYECFCEYRQVFIRSLPDDIMFGVLRHSGSGTCYKIISEWTGDIPGYATILNAGEFTVVSGCNDPSCVHNPCPPSDNCPGLGFYPSCQGGGDLVVLKKGVAIIQASWSLAQRYVSPSTGLLWWSYDYTVSGTVIYDWDADRQQFIEISGAASGSVRIIRVSANNPNHPTDIDMSGSASGIINGSGILTGNGWGSTPGGSCRRKFYNSSDRGSGDWIHPQWLSWGSDAPGIVAHGLMGGNPDNQSVFCSTNLFGSLPCGGGQADNHLIRVYGNGFVTSWGAVAVSGMFDNSGRTYSGTADNAIGNPGFELMEFSGNYTQAVFGLPCGTSGLPGGFPDPPPGTEISRRDIEIARLVEAHQANDPLHKCRGCGQ